MAKKSQNGNFAAITQHSSGFRYLELSGKPGAYEVVRYAAVPAARTLSASGIASLLTEELGDFGSPVVFGLPMRECMVRVIEYPRMPAEEAKQALQFDFDSYFAWPYSECSVDVCEVESPLTPPEGKMSMLVAACRNEHISKILRITECAGIELKAIEPMNVSLLRAVMGHNFINRGDEAWCSIYSDADGIHFAFADKGNGLVYRSSPAGIKGIFDAGNRDDVLRAVSEIQRTISFVNNQFKGVPIGVLAMSGAIAADPDAVGAVQSSTGLRTEVIDVYERCGVSSADADVVGPGFEPALGLCMY